MSSNSSQPLLSLPSSFSPFLSFTHTHTHTHKSKNCDKSWAQLSSQPFVTHLPFRDCFLFSWVRCSSRCLCSNIFSQIFLFLKQVAKHDGAFCYLQRGLVVASLEPTASSRVMPASFFKLIHTVNASSPRISPIPQKTFFWENFNWSK